MRTFFLDATIGNISFNIDIRKMMSQDNESQKFAKRLIRLFVEDTMQWKIKMAVLALVFGIAVAGGSYLIVNFLDSTNETGGTIYKSNKAAHKLPRFDNKELEADMKLFRSQISKIIRERVSIPNTDYRDANLMMNVFKDRYLELERKRPNLPKEHFIDFMLKVEDACKAHDNNPDLGGLELALDKALGTYYKTIRDWSNSQQK